MRRINQADFGNKEWLVTNGLGSYAASTLHNINTRKFHGLLVVARSPPSNRWVILSTLNEQIRIENKLYQLKNHPVECVVRYFPTFLYNVDCIQIKKTVLLPRLQNCTIVKYEFQLSKSADVTFMLSPCVNSRHFYDTTIRNSITFHQKQISENRISVLPSNCDIEIELFCNASYKKNECWLDCTYPLDKARNEEWHDSVFQIGDFETEISNGKKIYFAVSTDEIDFDEIRASENKTIKYYQALIKRAGLPGITDELVIAADSFLVQRNNGKSIIAGYHWFSDWGRDCFIALPGVALVTKRYNDAKQVIFTFSKYCNGLIPNVFSEQDNTPSYNAVDASLWYIDTVFQYFKYTNDIAFIKKIWHSLQSIVQCYIASTTGVGMDEDCLIKHGPGLTWMDVKIDNAYITPREGKAVEIQALWYNALSIMQVFSDILKDNSKDYSVLKDKAKDNFLKKFTYFYDVVEPPDKTIRPNLIFLVSLDFSMLDSNLQGKIVKHLENTLLTEVGLRTLDKNNTQYFGTLLGSHNKDIAYHNGCVWPWLTGAFVRSFLKVKKYDERWRTYAYENFIKPLLTAERQQCVGYIPEIFDGDEPHAPQGCVAQAWSVAEILRTYVEDIMLIRPKYEAMLAKYGLNVPTYS